MFSMNYIRSIYGYHFWANEQILKKAVKLPEPEYFEDLEIGHGSLHNTLFHMLRTEEIWLSLIKTGSIDRPPQIIGNFPDLKSIQLVWKEIEVNYLRYLDQAKEEEFAQIVQVTDQNGVITPFQRWRMLQHVLFHGAQHRSEAAVMLTHLGQSPGDLDFIFY